LLGHPLMEGGQVLAEAGGVLVCIVGGPDLTMSEVNRVMEQINRQSEQAHIIMGAAIDPEMSERLSVTLLAAKGGVIPEYAPRAVEPVASGPAPSMDFDRQMVNLATNSRPASRFIAPPPVLTPEKTEQLLTQQGGNGARSRKSASKMRQGQLPLEIVSRGRFEKSEPTIHQGQDLDVPTYIRRGVALN